MKTSNQQIVLSGIKPSGDLHLGNYLGAVKNYLELQKQYQCYYFVATYHSMTENFDPQEKARQIREITADFLALGLDPKKAVIFNQADVPECTELTWIFNCIIPVAELERMTQYKDKSAKNVKNINMGLLDYPVLMVADILLYHANGIPIGHDQVQHLELTNDIARRFNNKFGQYFNEVKPLFTQFPKVMSLQDPTKKMSKSYGENHVIALKDTPEIIREKIKSAVTGTGTEDSIPPGTLNLMLLLNEFGTKEEAAYFNKALEQKTIKYSELKEVLAKDIADFFSDYRAKKQELIANPEIIEKVLAQGAKQARKIAQKTIAEVKELIGVKV